MRDSLEYVRHLAQEEAESGHTENAAALHGLLQMRKALVGLLQSHQEGTEEDMENAWREACAALDANPQPKQWTVLGYFADDEAVFAYEVEAADTDAAIRQAVREYSEGHCIPFHQAASNMMLVDIVEGWSGAVGDFERVMSAADLLPD